MTDYTKLPRVYVDTPLIESDTIDIGDGAHHYLKNVMRVQSGEEIRLFNGRDGEYLGRVVVAGKKTLSIQIEKKLKPQKNNGRKIHLLFAPIKKERMDFLIEKAVELGATDIHPVFTQNTDMRKIKEDRLNAQIIEAAEQCERLDIPSLHPAQDLFPALAVWNKSVPFLAALERFDAVPLRQIREDGDCAILIGPSGGFTEEEKQKIAALTFIKPVSLGENILRSETAVVAALAILTA